MATGSVISKREGSSCRSPIVVPSSQLDSNLHQKAAEIVKNRHFKEEEEVSIGDGNYGDDLLTSPDVLLERALKQAEHMTTEMGVVIGIQEERMDELLDCWIRCTALARIVHGDTHWVLAKTHIQLGRAYLEFKDLSQQALLHAIKARDILTAPGSGIMSHDPPFEVMCQLATAHCVMSRVYTVHGDLPKAEQEMLKARKVFSRAKQLPDCGVCVELEKDILIALARLDLKQGRFGSSRENFIKLVNLIKSGFGPNSTRLLPPLRGQATAETRLSLYDAATHTLQEALEIAEANHGVESEVVAEMVQAQGKLGALQLRGGVQVDIESVEEKFSRAISIFSTVLDADHEKSLSCKEDLCLVLATQPQSQQKAIPLLKELVAAKKVTYGDSSVEVGHSLKLLATVLLAQGEAMQARTYLLQAKDVYCCSLGTKHRETLTIAKSLETISGSTDSDYAQSKPYFKTVV